MAQVFLLLNHFVQFFLMPIAWAALFCLGTQCLFAKQAKQSGKSWLQRSKLAGAAACVLTLLIFPFNNGQSSMAYYGLLGLLLISLEAWQLKIWRA